MLVPFLTCADNDLDAPTSAHRGVEVVRCGVPLDIRIFHKYFASGFPFPRILCMRIGRLLTPGLPAPSSTSIEAARGGAEFRSG